MRTAVALSDQTNVKLLRLMQAKPRATFAELARAVGMSPPAVKERIVRLEESGVIERYQVELSPRALGYQVLAFIRVRPMPGRENKIIKLAQALPEVTECHRVTGEDCFVLKVYVTEVAALEGVVAQLLAHGDTTTSIVQSSPVRPRSLPIANAR